MPKTRLYIHNRAPSGLTTPPPLGAFWNTAVSGSTTDPAATVREMASDTTADASIAYYRATEPSIATTNSVLGLRLVSPSLSTVGLLSEVKIVVAMGQSLDGDTYAKARWAILSGAGSIIYEGTSVLGTSEVVTGSGTLQVLTLIPNVNVPSGSRVLVDIGAEFRNVGTYQYFVDTTVGVSAATVTDAPATQGAAGTASQNYRYWVDLTFSDAPNPPLYPSTTEVSGRTAAVRWSAPTSGPAPTSYELDINGQLSSSNSSSTEMILKGLTPGTNYTVKVRSVSAGGASSWSTPITFSTTDGGVFGVSWSEAEKRFFDTGLDRGVLYPKGTPPPGPVLSENKYPYPSFEAQGVLSTVETNLFPYPSFEAVGASAVVETNLLVNPSAETAGGWNANNGTTHAVTRDTTVKRSGSQSVKSVLNAGQTTVETLSLYDVGIVSTRTPLAANNLAAAAMWFMTPNSGYQARVSLIFLDSAGAAIGTHNYGTYVALTPNVWARASVYNITAPTGSATVRMYAFVSKITGNAVAGDVAYADDAMLVNSWGLGAYFDGTTSAADEFTYAWTGTPHSSTSTRSASSVTGVSGGGGSAISSSDWASTGTRSLRLYSKYHSNGSGYFDLGSYCDWGKTYTIRATVRIREALTTAPSISASTIGNTPQMVTASTSTPGTTPGVYSLKLTFTLPASGGGSKYVRFLNNNANGASVWVDDILIVEGSDAPTYFDGSSAVSGDFAFTWSGTAHQSTSLKQGVVTPTGGSVGGAVAIQSIDWASSGTKSLRVYSKHPTSGSAYVELGQSVEWGKTYTIRAKVRIKDPLPFKPTIQAFTLGNTPNLTPTQAVYTPSSDPGVYDVSLTFAIPPLNGGTGKHLRLYNNNAYGTSVWFDDIIITEGSLKDSPSYFSGDSADTGKIDYSWSGVANQSTSIMRENQSLAVAWLGLTGVEEEGGDSAAAYYIDGRPFLFLPRPKEFKASLKAYTYPDAFAQIMGVAEIADGMYLDSQPGEAFDLSYRTLVGNGIDGVDHGYKIHLVYNATVSPQALSYESLSNSINPTTFSWEIQAVPVQVEGFRPTAHIIIDTRHMEQSKIDSIEALLYGSEDGIPNMPTPQVIFDLLSFGDTIIVTDNGDGTFEVTGSYDNVYLIESGVFRVDNADATDNGDGTFTISTTTE